MCYVTIRENTTANFVKARKRKLRNRKLREEADKAEAAKLGITVFQLKFNKYKEYLAAAKKAAERRAQEERVRRPTYGYGYY